MNCILNYFLTISTKFNLLYIIIFIVKTIYFTVLIISGLTVLLKKVCIQQCRDQ